MLLYEIYFKACGNHFYWRSLANKEISQGYWWLYVKEDVKDIANVTPVNSRV